MKSSTLLSWCVCVVTTALHAQTPDLWQDPSVKILGNVAHGPPLAPVTKLPETPPQPFPPWGPRAYPVSGRYANFSFRGLVGQGNQVVVGGFVVSKGQQILMIRAVGPSLVSFGVAGVLSRPRLELFDSAGVTIAVAVPWSTTSADTMLELKKTAVDIGAFALQEGSEDQVLLVVLKPGIYTCVVSGLNGATGLVLLEGYEVPSLGGGGG